MAASSKPEKLGEPSPPSGDQEPSVVPGRPELQHIVSPHLHMSGNNRDR